jgi:glycosyltransferase involved in cell wall biosynthesis
VVVDNGSTDGSRELLNALHAAGLIHLIRNRNKRYHGPP